MTDRRLTGESVQAAVTGEPARRTHAQQAQVLLQPPTIKRVYGTSVMVLLPNVSPSRLLGEHVSVLSRMKVPFLTADGTHMQRKLEGGEWEYVFHVYDDTPAPYVPQPVITRAYFTAAAAPVAVANHSSWTLDTSNTASCLMSANPGTTDKNTNTNSTASRATGTLHLFKGVSEPLAAGVLTGSFRAALRMSQSIFPFGLSPRVVVRLFSAAGVELAVVGTADGSLLPANGTQYARALTGPLTQMAVPEGARLVVEYGFTKTGDSNYYTTQTSPIPAGTIVGDLDFADATLGANGDTIPPRRSWFEFTVLR